MVRNSEYFIEGDSLLHFDWPVSEQEALQLDAEHVGKLANELLVRRSDLPTIMLIVMNSPLLEVR